MESDQYLIVYWDTQSGGEPSWVWTLHDRGGTEIERGSVGGMAQDDVTGAKTAAADQRGCPLIWQAGQHPDVVAFVGRPAATGVEAPTTKGRGQVLADAAARADDAAIRASDTAATADDMRTLARGQDTLGVDEDLASMALRFARRASTRWRTRRKSPTRHGELPPHATGTDPGAKPQH